VAASVTANILHAQPNPISQAIAAWPPLALLLTVELISRVPVHRRGLAFARLAATATIAGIAAWVSYWHMAGVAARYGETGASPYLLPLSVDGLIVVASVCLVELAARINDAERAAAGERTAQAARAAEPAAAQPAQPAQAAPQTPAAPGPGVEPTPPSVEQSSAVRADLRRAVAEIADLMPAKPAKKSTADRPKRTTSKTKTTAGPRQRRPVAETAALAAAIEAVQPDATDADIARQLGISTSRLRAIRREMREYQPTN
jgi:hypothetical protein